MWATLLQTNFFEPLVTENNATRVHGGREDAKFSILQDADVTFANLEDKGLPLTWRLVPVLGVVAFSRRVTRKA